VVQRVVNDALGVCQEDVILLAHRRQQLAEETLEGCLNGRAIYVAEQAREVADHVD